MPTTPTDAPPLVPHDVPPSPTYPILTYFAYTHLPPHLQSISAPFHALAHQFATTLPYLDEVQAGLRKLLEAKDCMVRAGLAPPAQPPSPQLVLDLPEMIDP